MKILSIALFFLIFSLSTVAALGEPFMDDFNRPDSVTIGNDWSTQTNGTIKVEIVDKEILISGKQGTDWVRCGLSRTVNDETKIYFDFLASDSFNVHIRIDDTVKKAYIDIYAWPGGPFSYASSLDGVWPGWVEIPGSNMIAGQYNNLGVEKKDADFMLYLNGKKVGTMKNENLNNITKVLVASDAAAGTVGSLHIDNVIIGEPKGVSPRAVEPSSKVSALWGKLKRI